MGGYAAIDSDLPPGPNSLPEAGRSRGAGATGGTAFDKEPGRFPGVGGKSFAERCGVAAQVQE